MNEWRLLRLRTCAREYRRAHRWGIQTAKEAVGGVRFGGLSPVRQKKNNNKNTPPAPPSWQETRRREIIT